jgi:hypothetical protein
MTTEMMGLDVADFSLSRFVRVDVHRVEVLADVVQGFQLWVNGAADVGLYAQVEEPGVDPGCW